MRFTVSGLTTRQTDIALTATSLCGVVLVFMPFALDYVPIFDLDWNWWATPHVTLVLPCIVLPPIITLGYILRLVSGRLPGWFMVGGYFLAVISAGAFLAVLFGELDISARSAILAIGAVLLAFVSGAWLSITGVNITLAVGGLIAMQCVYVTLIVFALAMAIFWDRLQIGAWLGAIALAAYLTQISLALQRPMLIFVLIVPLALIGLVYTGMLGRNF
jgi:hypothetical protein